MTMALKPLMVLFCLTFVAAGKVRKFIQVSDFHYDELYSQGSPTNNSCHFDGRYGSGSDSTEAGRMGDFRCDSPKQLVKSAIQAMHKVLPDPDFILWTGDNSPHDGAGARNVTRNLKFISKWIYQVFGSRVKVIPVLGNHDSDPKDTFEDMKVDKKKARQQYRGYTIDGALIDFIKDEADFFNEHCGYYAVRNSSLYDNMTQTFLVLNTVLYHPHNIHHVDKKDPCGQLKWLDEQLRNATSDERVFIVAHIPPGYFELWTEEPFFGDEAITAKYLQIVGKRSNAKKIVAHFYGHTHTSSFRLFWDDPNRHQVDGPVGVGFIAPSVTPLMYQGGVNPSFRVYEYDPQGRKIVTFKQYYLQLANANKGSSEDQLNITLVDQDDNETTTPPQTDRTQFDRKIDSKKAVTSKSRRQRNNGKILHLQKREMDNIHRVLTQMSERGDRFVTGSSDYDHTEDDVESATVNYSETTTDGNCTDDCETSTLPSVGGETTDPSSIETTTEPSATETEGSTTLEPITTTSSPVSSRSWNLAFDARDDLEVSELSVAQMYKAYRDMRNDPNGTVFRNFYRDFTVLNDIGPCNTSCHAQMMCVVINYQAQTLRDCMRATAGIRLDDVTSLPPVDVTTVPEDTDGNPPITTSDDHDPSWSPTTSATTTQVFTSTDNSVDVPVPITRAPPPSQPSPHNFPSASLQALAVVLALGFIALVGGVSFWYYRRYNTRYRSQETFLLADTEFSHGYSQLDQW